MIVGWLLSNLLSDVYENLQLHDHNLILWGEAKLQNRDVLREVYIRNAIYNLREVRLYAAVFHADHTDKSFVLDDS